LKASGKLWRQDFIHRLFHPPNSGCNLERPYGAKKHLIRLIFDAHLGELDFMLLDLPQEPGIYIKHYAILAESQEPGSCKYSTGKWHGQMAAKEGDCSTRFHKRLPVWGIVKNMAYFTPEGIAK